MYEYTQALTATMLAAYKQIKESAKVAEVGIKEYSELQQQFIIILS
jgi:hypothetical protein